MSVKAGFPWDTHHQFSIKTLLSKKEIVRRVDLFSASSICFLISLQCAESPGSSRMGVIGALGFPPPSEAV